MIHACNDVYSVFWVNRSTSRSEDLRSSRKRELRLMGVMAKSHIMRPLQSDGGLPSVV
jgi:hypothetical protein